MSSELATVIPSVATPAKPIRTIMAAHKYGYAYPYLGLFLGEDESVQYHSRADDGTEYGPAGGDTILGDGEWHTLVVTNDGTTLTVWIDGVAEVTTLAFAGAFTGVTKFLLGALVGSFAFRSLQGETIKGAGVWTRALSQAEIQRLTAEFG